MTARAAMTEQDILRGANARIERYRKADAVVRVVDARGKPVPGAKVRIEQVRHAFLFGANAFPLLGDADPGRGALYEKRFTDLLNYATLGFYWGAYEREPGKTDEARLRRQAVWLKARGIPAKGHPLVWHEVWPGWAPTDPDAARGKLEARVTSIVSHFAGLIDRWDVVNEATVSAKVDNGLGRWVKRDGEAKVVETALGWARAANPKSFLLYNDYNLGKSYEALADTLVKDHAPVSALGIQSHMHNGEWPIPRVWEVCETYAKYGKPLDFTEVTVLSGEHGWERPAPWPSTPEGETRQADYVEKLYTVLFSHPAVEAITWWDLQDGAWQGAPAGLVRADLSPKPAYQRLMKKIHGAWWTALDRTTGKDGAARFRGFLGRYRVSVTTSAGAVSREMDLRRGAPNALTVRLP
jgi:GH35 family endo-1,4-beta-xylanase